MRRALSFPPLLPGARNRWLGLALLVRWVPVASWIGGSIAIGTGAALRHWRTAGAGFASLPAPSAGPFPASHGERSLAVALIATAGVLLQGLAAHAWNDREDWRTGTDPANPALLSGGSKAVHRGLLGAAHLTWTAAGAVAAAGLIALHFTLHRGAGALLLWLIAVWAAGAYSLPPLRLAYRPLAGEWLCAWPAIVAGAAGTFYLLTGALTLPVLAAGAVHGLFCLAWLMQHHLVDVRADLAADPAKLTTPAWLYRRVLTARPGRPARSPAGATRLARLPAQAYYALATLASLAAATLTGLCAGFGAAAGLGLAGLFLARGPRESDLLDDVATLTRQETVLIALSLAEAACLAAGLALGPATGGSLA